MAKSETLCVRNLGPIGEANVEFGDLTVVVGPQASGKSIFLQTLKLLVDRDNIHETFRIHSVDFKGRAEAFLDGYFGNGMSSLWRPEESEVKLNGKSIDLLAYAKPSKSKNGDRCEESLFFIPAQRVVSLPQGQTQTFGAYRFGDPYTLRAFSDVVHRLLQNEFGAEPELFPKANRLDKTLREQISRHLFGGADLKVDDAEYTKRLVLNIKGGAKGLPFLAWSAGQREFTPLLLGLYWLCPAGKVSTRDSLEWVVIEEPEMGLHPQAIETVLLLILELLKRGYRVVVSTHSPHVLDLLWALQFFRLHHGIDKDVRDLLSLRAGVFANSLAKAALEKIYKVYFFQRDGRVQDISHLDPASESAAESGWGGLSEFSGRVGDVVARVASREMLMGLNA